MIVAGPEVPEAKESNTAVTLADIAPTVLEAVGLPYMIEEEKVGRSLVELKKESMTWSVQHLANITVLVQIALLL